MLHKTLVHSQCTHCKALKEASMPSAPSNSPSPPYQRCGVRADGGHLLLREALLVGAAEVQVQLAGVHQVGVELRGGADPK